MLKNSYSAAELAALRMSGYPTSERWMRERLDREVSHDGVVEVPSAGCRKCRREYLFLRLPKALREAIVEHSTREAGRNGAALPAPESPNAGAPSSLVPALAGGVSPQGGAAGFLTPKAAGEAPALQRPAEAGPTAGPEAGLAARHGHIEGAKRGLAARVSDSVRAARRESGLRAAHALTPALRRRADARLAILRAFDAFRAAAALPVKRAAPAFVARYAAGEVTVEPPARALYADLCVSSLLLWRRLLREGGVQALAGRPGARAGRSKIEEQPPLREFVAAMLTAYPHVNTSHVMQGIRARFNGHSSLDYPSYSSLHRWIVGWKRDNAHVFAAVANPDAWKSNYMAAFGSASEDVARLNQRWEFDSTPADVMLTDGRHTVLGVVDVLSRRGRMLVSKTSRAVAVATLTRHALLDWGVPETVKTDNGADYVSRHMVRVFMGLGIEQRCCEPFQPWQKPHIERFFRTFSHDLVELLPGFIGHNVAEREAIRSRQSFADRLMTRGEVLEISMSSAELQHLADRWCEDIYGRRPHDGLRGRTPFEVVAAWRAPVRRIGDERALDVLLAEAPGGDGLRRVGKKGIALDQTWFIAPDLALHIGATVQVRYDPQDLGRIYVFAESGEYLCTAEAPQRTGMDRQEVAAKARELQKAVIQEERRALKAAAKRLKTDDIVQEILVERAQAAGKLALLPAAAEPHSTDALDQAARAARPQPAVPVAQFTAEDQARLDAIAEEMARPKAVDITSIGDPRFRYAHWLRLDERLRSGVALDEREREFHRGFAGTAEWRAQKGVFEDFGLTAEDFQ